MNIPVPTTPSLATDVYWPMMQSASLIAAGELGVFRALADGPLPASDLAQKVGASVDGITRLGAMLVQTGYLERLPDDRLANSSHAREWLSGTGASDLGSGLRWFAHAWRLMSDLAPAVRRGGPATALWELMASNPEMGPAFAAYMKDHAATVVADVQRAVTPPPHARRLLDVGGSHGLHAAAFCRRLPGLTGVILDLPVSLVNTRPLLAGWGLEGRIECVAGDIVTDDIPGTYDLITCFLVLHNQTDADGARIVRRMAGALNPGGMLLIYEYPRDPAARFSRSALEADAAAFDLTLLVETGTRLHTAERIQAWLREAGLENPVRTDLEPAEKGAVFCASRPR